MGAQRHLMSGSSKTLVPRLEDDFKISTLYRAPVGEFTWGVFSHLHKIWAKNDKKSPKLASKLPLVASNLVQTDPN